MSGTLFFGASADRGAEGDSQSQVARHPIWPGVSAARFGLPVPPASRQVASGSIKVPDTFFTFFTPMSKCPQCGYDLQGHADHDRCPECGREIYAAPAVLTCRHCGEGVPAGFEVCWNCGRAIATDDKGE